MAPRITAQRRPCKWVSTPVFRQWAASFRRFWVWDPTAIHPNVGVGQAVPNAVQTHAPSTALESLVAILGIPFHSISLGGAVDRVEAMIAHGGSHYVVTPNVDFLVKAQRDGELRRILVHADLVLCDGKPIVWASRWLGGILPARVAGSDLIPRLLARAEEKGWRVFLLGGSPEVASEAAQQVGAAYPLLRELAHYSPPFLPLGKMDNADIISRVHAASPDLMLVCFGCPKQEKWISQHRLALRVPVMIGAGATIDFLAGRMARAPLWMRRSGTEWLFRLLQEPTRLAKRYGDDFLHFFPAILLQRWRQRPSSPRQKKKGGP